MPKYFSAKKQKNCHNKIKPLKIQNKAFQSQSDFCTFFPKSKLGFHFWTFIFVHF